MQKQKDFKILGHEVSAKLDQQVLRSLRRIFHAVDRHSRRLARQHGLTEPQAICLHAIHEAGQINPGQLARIVSLSPPTVTGILDRLERRGLIQRARTARDKRQVVVCLTDTGKQVLAASPPPLQERFTQRLSALPPARQRRIAEALNEVVKLLEAENIDAAPLLAHGAANPAHADTSTPPAGTALNTSNGPDSER